jgi:hypothetical protein
MVHRSNGKVNYETTIIEERLSRHRPKRNYYAKIFTQKLTAQSPTEHARAYSKPKAEDPFKTGRHLMMPITALI